MYMYKQIIVDNIHDVVFLIGGGWLGVYSYCPFIVSLIRSSSHDRSLCVIGSCLVSEVGDEIIVLEWEREGDQLYLFVSVSMCVLS